MNQAEIETWNGALGERWALLQEAMDPRIRVFGRDALAQAALAEGQRVLDVGCGCADLAIEAAQAVGPNGRVVGLDVSKPMLARGRERVATLANVSLVEADASTFTADAPFDAIISRFGVMFFDDPRAAFMNLRRALKPGGQLAFVCWQTLAANPWATVPLQAIATVASPPKPAAPDAPGPFAFADSQRVRGILTGAGFADVTLTPAVHPIKLGDSLDDAVTFASCMGPSSRALRDLDEETQARAVGVLRETLATLAPSFTLDGAVWVVNARA